MTSMASPASSKDSELDLETKISLTKDIVTDIFRLQGEEVIRVRKELEKSLNLNKTAFELFRTTDQRMSEMQNTFRRRHMQISFLEGMILGLHRENDASLVLLESIRENMRRFCGSGVVDFDTHDQSSKSSSSSDESSLLQSHFADDQSDLKESNRLDSLRDESEVVDRFGDFSSTGDELTKAMQNISTTDLLELSEAQSDDWTSAGLEDPVSLFETLRQELIDALSNTNDLQYQLDAALRANEALEEKVVELSTRASIANSEIDNVNEEYMNNSNDAGDKHGSISLADEPSMSLKDVVVGEPDLIPATVPALQVTSGTGVDDVDSSKSAVVDQSNSVVVNDRSGSLLPPASHVNSGNTSLTNSLQRKFVSVMTLCLPINLVGLQAKEPAKLNHVDDICSKVLGYSPTFLQGYPKGKLIIDLHNQNGATLITVSHDANTLCRLLRKELNTHWKDTFIVLENGPVKSQTTKQLHVLGEYAYRGTPPSQLALSDYELLPERAKDFIFDSAKSTRYKEIKTKEQLVASLVQPGGIVVHGITLETVRPRKVLEQLIAGEARQRGLLQVT
ncbi:hypothetical protein BT96DRAFT_431799 [Gymnopus androsaceus JB14]|uniref:Uncharacterized protein n=1 Tax=Gymnopus androsaceus JB14 TaxID=1447944 RepID=A0A6A4GTJ1_9AGAR|nr:hypothetical protein BT96DRAFT_431799 [Gymnopus androsaceus JB14]